MMKIVYYLPSLIAPGGIERIITYKANWFAKHNYDITIITSEQMGKKPYFTLSQKVKHIDINVPFDYPQTKQSLIDKIIKYPFRYARFKHRFSKVLNDLHPDITISTMRREVNFICGLKDGSIKIGEFHVTRYAYGAEAFVSRNPFIRLLKRRWSIAFLKNLSKLSKVVILTHEGAKDWPELNNIVVIPNPICIPLGNRQSNNTAHQIIAVGRYAPQKGFDLLIDAWSIVAQKHPDWSLQIYGEGSLRNSLEQQIKNFNLEKNCFLQHTVTNIAEKYAESSIFVLSSRYEGFGMVITEAMSCGVPVVSFACPCGPKDIISENIDGLLVKPENTDELAEKIIYLIEHEEERKKMGHEAYLKSKQFTMEQIALKWINLFNTILNEKKRKEV